VGNRHTEPENRSLSQNQSVPFLLPSRNHMKFTMMKYLTLICLIFATVSAHAANSGRQLVAPTEPETFPFRTVQNQRTIDDNVIEDSIDNRIIDIELDEETEDISLVDSFFAQSRIVDRVNDFLKAGAKENPGCVERFVCETYRTGETMEGIPYLLMQLTNAAVSFMVADMFDKSINIKVLTRAARDGRKGNCHASDTMKCDLLDNQLRTLGDYLSTFEEFLTQIFNSVSESLNFGR